METFNVLILAPRLLRHGPSGTARHAHNLALGLSREGHNVEILTTDAESPYDSELENGGVMIHTIKGSWSESYSHEWWVKISEIISRTARDYDVIHSMNMAAAGLLKYSNLTVKNTPVITSFTDPEKIHELRQPHTYAAFRVGKITEKNYLSAMSHIIVPNTTTRDILVGKYARWVPDIGEKVSVVQRCVDTDKFTIGDKSRYKWKRLLYLGSVEEDKGLMNILRAGQALYETDRKIKVIIAGHGSYIETLRSLSPPNMEITGELPNESVIDLYQNASLFLAPAMLSDVVPYPVLEAMSTGLPVLAEEGQIMENGLVDWGVEVTGSSDIESYVNIITSMLSNPEHLEDMGKKAREYILERHSLRHSIRTILSLYRKIL